MRIILDNFDVAIHRNNDMGDVTRFPVPGGWLYRIDMDCSVFVPGRD